MVCETSQNKFWFVNVVFVRPAVSSHSALFSCASSISSLAEDNLASHSQDGTTVCQVSSTRSESFEYVPSALHNQPLGIRPLPRHFSDHQPQAHRSHSPQALQHSSASGLSYHCVFASEEEWMLRSRGLRAVEQEKKMSRSLLVVEQEERM